MTEEHLINEIFIKVSGRIPVSAGLNFDKDIEMTIDNQTYVCEVIKKEFEKKQNGMYDVIFKTKYVRPQ